MLIWLYFIVSCDLAHNAEYKNEMKIEFLPLIRTFKSSEEQQSINRMSTLLDYTHLKSSLAQSSSGRRHKWLSLHCRCHGLNTGPDTWPWQSHSWLRPSLADSDTHRGYTRHGLNNWGLCSPLETDVESLL